MERKTLIPRGWQSPFWLIFMIGVSVVFSLGFACAVPLAAFGAMAALTLGRRDAVLFTGAVWLANQAVGYSILGYPLSANSFAWGAVLGLAAILAMLAARWSGMRFAGLARAVIPVVAFATAFVAYEGILFVAGLTPLGGADDFTVAIIARVLEINAIAMAALLLLNHFGARVKGFRAPDLNGFQVRLPS